MARGNRLSPPSLRLEQFARAGVLLGSGGPIAKSQLQAKPGADPPERIPGRGCWMPRILPEQPDISPAVRPGTGLTTLLACCVVVAALYFGQAVFVPFALAILLSFVLAPGVHRLQRWRVGRVTAVGMVVAAACLVLLCLGGLIATQV